MHIKTKGLDGGLSPAMSYECGSTSEMPRNTAHPFQGLNHGRPFNNGFEPKLVSLKVVPHYWMWDIANNGRDEVLMPYETQREPMGRKAWLELYVKNAPLIQRAMDQLARRIVKRKNWTCWSKDDIGTDLPLTGTKFRVMRDACHAIGHRRLLLADVGPKTYFDSSKCDPEGRCHCQPAVDKHFKPITTQPNCESLMCYERAQQNKDVADVHKALEKMEQRSEECAVKVTDELVRQGGWPSTADLVGASLAFCTAKAAGAEVCRVSRGARQADHAVRGRLLRAGEPRVKRQRSELSSFL